VTTVAPACYTLAERLFSAEVQALMNLDRFFARVAAARIVSSDAWLRQQWRFAFAMAIMIAAFDLFGCFLFGFGWLVSDWNYAGTLLFGMSLEIGSLAVIGLLFVFWRPGNSGRWHTPLPGNLCGSLRQWPDWPDRLDQSIR
jgi:hypothetical protein